MNLEQKDMILMPYPFTNLETSKVRPAIVISNDKFNKSSNDVIAVPLTSHIKNLSFSILIGEKDLERGKLLKPSSIRADKIFAVEKKLAVMKIGRIRNNVLEKIKTEILKIM